MNTPTLATNGPGGVPPVRAAGTTSLVVWCDQPDAARGWCEALAGEGIAAHARALDDQAPDAAEAFALVLFGTHLTERLARLRALRAVAGGVPLVVAARGLRDLDQVLAFEMGADDAFDADLAAPVVAARLRALWRRGRGEAEIARELRYGSLRLSLGERAAHLADARVPLTEGEFEVLWLLATHAGQAMSRREILRRVRGLDDHPTDRSIDSRVYRIRAKLGDHDAPVPRIRTVRNHGYAFSPVGW